MGHGRSIQSKINTVSSRTYRKNCIAFTYLSLSSPKSLSDNISIQKSYLRFLNKQRQSITSLQMLFLVWPVTVWRASEFLSSWCLVCFESLMVSFTSKPRATGERQHLAMKSLFLCSWNFRDRFNLSCNTYQPWKLLVSPPWCGLPSLDTASVC